MLLNKIKDTKKYAIFGAQVVAYGAYEAILHLTGVNPTCFAVGKLEGNRAEIQGIPVKRIDEVEKDTFLVVAVTELVQKEVLPLLQEKGFLNLYPLTQEREYALMSTYFDAIGRFPKAESIGIESEEQDLVLYEVRNHRDVPLQREVPLKAYEQPIQAGRGIAEKEVAPLGDHTGQSISHKNRQYCEMTAVYWIWKNTQHAWKGIEHYRRHMLITPAMLTEEVDVLMPYPYICYPDTTAQLLRFIKPEILAIMKEVLKRQHPQQYDAYMQILYGRYQYTYNLVCARREVFDAYCQWFFAITEEMETYGQEVPELLNTRALSYVAEALTNIYFMSNQKQLRIRHVQREIYT